MRVCPSCARRDAMLVDPSCPVCEGAGVLALGKAALSKYSPEVVSDAIELALEAAAIRCVTEDPAAPVRGDAVPVLRDRMVLLRRLKIVGDGPGGASDAKRPRSWIARHADSTRLANTVPGVQSKPGDRTRLDAPPIDVSKVRVDRGGIPGFSWAGFICGLARAVDPYDPLGVDRKSPQVRGQRRFQAESLALFAEEGNR